MGDMPFGSYQESPEQAIRSACRKMCIRDRVLTNEALQHILNTSKYFDVR